MHNRWGSYPTLGRMVFLTVREALHSRPHPDSKRQARRKARDLTRYGARILKDARVTSCPLTRTSKRREVRLMRQRLQEERELQARTVAARLLGKRTLNCPDCRGLGRIKESGLCKTCFGTGGVWWRNHGF